MQYSILWINKNTHVQENVQIGCTGYVHIAAVWMMENNGYVYSLLKRFGCTTIHNKVLYKCIIHSFINFKKTLNQTNL